ncbi:putative ethanolamine kinase [Fulvia fulva]|uniref:ethanolamine kinase n=1 Tax=Passalora fulva TaxID=5499 RepID=A0A9Q8P4D6_PASFU|nr:putative ethanolamine kinase [Fulvia fulva]KAK4636337.1 putative ethanolamine kinase [Fulvia fulva]KAK4638418.1 putative ethanolamine kinase [Fulvia fulva]UJO12749.1 putative ethanolamine kinase [Fulvia fulva]WPV09848.1 putative ethanolamine kinase [Fulvia fulva]WPV25015.1 putative ethanolamine kinase [Fulvia fulva]
MSSTHQNASTDLQIDRTDSPLGLRHIPVTFDNTEPEKSALRLIEDFRPQWKTEEGEVKFTRFTDGITNVLMKATKRRPGRTDLEIDKDAILMRAYGKGTDVLIDRERELRSHNLLASLGLAPPLLARFDNGLMYSFIPGHVCSHKDLARPEIYRQVAKRLGQWHGSLPISAITATPMLDAESDQKHLNPRKGQSTRPYPNTWTILQQWIDALPENTDKEKERKSILNVELAEMSSKLGDTPGIDGKNYVFVHHDLLCGNVIVTEDDESTQNNATERPVTFIDYEYATPGNAAFDIANHFAEFAGYDCEHSAVPAKSQRKEFIQEYVKSYRYHSISDNDTTAVDIDFQKDIETLYEQVEQFRGMPGLFWGVWALIQATISQIDFDYVTYAELRLSEYWAYKEEEDGSREREGREMHIREKKWHSE